MLVRAFPRLGVNPGLGRRRWLHLTPREIDKLELHQVGLLAQKRLARGLKLNQPEATALIATVCLEKIRDGHSVAQLMTLGQRLLGRRQVLPGVAELVSEVQVEGTFRDGTKLLTVHDPIASDDGDLHLALHGSFLPLPDREIFGDAGSLAPGAVKCDGAPITLNAGRDVVEVRVTNAGDRPIQVGSHYHFLETNAALVFDRREAYGRRLNVPSGASVRFEPGERKVVSLVDIAGGRVVTSGNLLTDGPATAGREAEVMARVAARGFGHEDAGSAPGAPLALERAHYAELYGPTVGDVVRLGDTDLTVRVERDHTAYGDECKFGGGKSLREGMGQQTGCAAADARDVVVMNAPKRKYKPSSARDVSSRVLPGSTFYAKAAASRVHTDVRRARLEAAYYEAADGRGYVAFLATPKFVRHAARVPPRRPFRGNPVPRPPPRAYRWNDPRDDERRLRAMRERARKKRARETRGVDADALRAALRRVLADDAAADGA